jgi:hypothetical protein
MPQIEKSLQPQTSPAEEAGEGQGGLAVAAHWTGPAEREGQSGEWRGVPPSAGGRERGAHPPVLLCRVPEREARRRAPWLSRRRRLPPDAADLPPMPPLRSSATTTDARERNQPLSKL